MKLGDAVVRVRSKNAGPFWVTIDVFCGTEEAYQRVVREFPVSRVAELVSEPESNVSKFEVETLAVVKFSFPRSVVQGSRMDRDMHGAQYAHLLTEAELSE